MLADAATKATTEAMRRRWQCLGRAASLTWAMRAGDSITSTSDAPPGAQKSLPLGAAAMPYNEPPLYGMVLQVRVAGSITSTEDPYPGAL